MACRRVGAAGSRAGRARHIILRAPRRAADASAPGDDTDGFAGAPLVRGSVEGTPANVRGPASAPNPGWTIRLGESPPHVPPWDPCRGPGYAPAQMSSQRYPHGALSILLALGLLATGVPSGPVAAAEPSAAVGSTAAPAASRPVRIDLYQPGDFVSQTNLVQCVGASMQMMLNMIRGTPDRTAATQIRLFNLARSLRDPTVTSNPSWRGASAQGWAAGLTAAGAGPYVVESAATLQEALALAALAIARTGRPVGLLVWQGAHAWVLNGFEATGDPATDSSARVTAVRVLDPLYPRPVGSPWGPGPAPDALLSVAQLGRIFVPYRPYSRSTELRNRFVIVLPLRPVVFARFDVRPV